MCLSTDRETALYPAALAANARRPIIHPRKIQINLLLFFAPPTKSQSCGRRGNACQKTADTSPSNSMIIENKKRMYTYLFWENVIDFFVVSLKDIKIEHENLLLLLLLISTSFYLCPTLIQLYQTSYEFIRFYLITFHLYRHT